MRLRHLLFSFFLLPLAACTQSWDQATIVAPPGGTGITAEGHLAQGEEAVSSTSELPSHGAAGAIEPYGTQGKNSAYEFAMGYRVGAGDRLTIRVAGETDLTADYLVDGSGNISMPYVRTVGVA